MNQFRINVDFEVILILLKGQSFGRHIAKLTGIPLTNIQRAIAHLKTDNVLDYKTEGRNKLYFLKNSIVARSIIISAESYKLIKIINKYPYLEPILKDVLAATDRQIILFGSHAKGLAKLTSDIDIFIETKDLKLKETIESINTRLSIKLGKLSKDDLLSKEIIADHVLIRGIEEYYEQFPW